MTGIIPTRFSQMGGALLGLLALAVALGALARSGSITVPQGENQRSFSSPEEARKALLAALRAKNRQALREIFGPGASELMTGDTVADEQFLGILDRALTAGSRIEKRDDSTAILHLGKIDFSFPIPIEKKEGKWFFNTPAGSAALTQRRIKTNEQSAVAFVRQCVLAQWEYFRAGDQDADGVPEFANAFLSTPGKHDGLYWKSAPGDRSSPLSSVIAYAKAQGYEPRQPGEGPVPFRAYYYRILTRQGANATGGAQDYAVNGNLTRGFAILAYPARYGSAGKLTFFANQLGKIYAKDLGPNTQELAAAMTHFDPDSTWTEAKE